MSYNNKTKNLGQMISDIKKEISTLELQIRSSYSKIKVGSVILTPQTDAWFTTTANQIEGNIAYKDSDNKVYVYNGSTWSALN